MAEQPRRAPGGPDIWVLILSDMVLFAVFFATFMFYKAANPELFLESQTLLNRSIGMINTVLLLTSSLCVALGVHRFGKARGRAFSFFFAAIVCGVGFVVLKIYEYFEKILQGVMPDKNIFFTLYFAFTGVHLLHVLLGLGVLVFLVVICRTKGAASELTPVIERGANFWHLVDLLWIVLFSLIYLLR